MTDEFLRLGDWLIRASSIDAIGPAGDETVVVLRNGFKLTLTRDEARELLKMLEPEGWRQDSA